jgi:putative ABC transport system permease protein
MLTHMRSLISNLRRILRLFVKSPGFTITAILILGIGIGANTAMFSLIEAVLLKPLPYPNPDQLVLIFQPFRNLDQVPLDYPDYLDFRKSQHSFQELAVCTNDDFNLAGQGNPERISGMYVSATFFQLLGRPFLMGRAVGEADRSDAPGVAVISEHFWRTHFHGDPSVIGKNLTIDGRSLQVIGVTPPQANELATVDLYVPLDQSRYFGTIAMTQRLMHEYFCFGRLKPGTTLEAAKADCEVIQNNLVTLYPVTNKGFGVRVVPYVDLVIGSFSGMLWVVEVAVACLLLITCANVANLLLTRSQKRLKEISIRAAVGANRRQLIVQLLLEDLALAVAGGAIGLLLSAWALHAIKNMAPPEMARFQDVKIDIGAVIFVLTVTLVTAVLSGLFPALVNSKINLASTLKQEGGRAGTAGRERRRGQSILVIGQVALTSILLIGAGLLARSFQALQNVPLGFQTDHILTADLYLVDSKYASQPACQALFDPLLERVRHLPGVTMAALNSALPFLPSAPTGDTDGFWVAGLPQPDQSQLPAWQVQFISPDYFRTVGIPLLRGRAFTNQDGTGTEKVVIISKSVADRFFPAQDPIGGRIYDFHDRVGLKQNFYTVIGVVGTVQYDNPETQVTSFQCYYPYSQNTEPMPINFGTLVIHAEGDPRSLIAPLHKLVADLDPNLPMSNAGLFSDLVAKSFSIRRLATVTMSFFSGTALLLAAVGLYAVLSYSVSQKTREIGVRIALGAQSRTILRLVIQRGLGIVGIGLLIGLASALALSGVIAGILYGVSAIDPISIGLSVIALVLTAFLACFLPAFRASRINPITALRE